VRFAEALCFTHETALPCLLLPSARIKALLIWFVGAVHHYTKQKLEIATSWSSTQSEWQVLIAFPLCLSLSLSLSSPNLFFFLLLSSSVFFFLLRYELRGYLTLEIYWNSKVGK
jgi:hypothetical protein